MTLNGIKVLFYFISPNFKIIKHKYDFKGAPELIYNINKVTRRNDFRLSENRSYNDL